ncbi:hypothetical protein, partial [Sphingomonas endophytica]
MRKAIAALCAGTMIAAPAATVAQDATPASVDLVNPLMGTDSSYELSYGNTYPAIALPFGMNAWTPVTG